MKGIVTLCGSTKFKAEFEEVNRRLTWSGWVVLSVGSFHHSEKDHDVAGKIIARKVKLDTLHKEKIAMSEAIVVINKGHYIGESTKSELSHAARLGKKIYWFENRYMTGNPDAFFELTPYYSWVILLDEAPDDLEPAENNHTRSA